VAEVKFKNPPISELVIGVYFEGDLPSFRAEHIGLFWNVIRDEFPTVTQQPILGQPGALEFTLDQFPMPRFWFEAADGVTLIQVQRNAFMLNWRKRDQAYPHYEGVKAAFDRYLTIFLEFLAKEASVTPSVHILELTYINTLVQNDYWSGLRDTATVLPLFRLPLIDDPENQPPDFTQVSTQRVDNDLTINVTVRSARSTKDASKPALVFELRALGTVPDVNRRTMDIWFDRAHAKIGACFLSMTSPDIQTQYWQPKA
jgi:uncharacterized protein (TIGR04255 family)